MSIINATMHNATPDQIAAGVIELPDNAKAELKKLLTFNDLPTRDVLEERASQVEQLIAETFKDEDYNAVMIGGAPFFQSFLEATISTSAVLKTQTYCHAFSRRECMETHNDDGSVSKSYVFKHLGFYSP